MRRIAFLLALVPALLRAAPFQTEYTLIGDRQITAKAQSPDGSKAEALLAIDPPEVVAVTDERRDKLPLFNPKAWGGWQKGYALQGVKAQECTVKDAFDAASLQVRDADKQDAAPFVRGVDYEIDPAWGSVGRLADGKIAESAAVSLSYRYALQRIDSIVWSVSANPPLVLRKGKSDVAQPKPPLLAEGEIRLLNVYVSVGKSKLADTDIFPVEETAFPDALAAADAGSAETLLPKTMEKLRSGTPLKILAWGDSVTEGRYVAEKERWQNQFVDRLRQRFPKANIELLTNAWSGHSTTDYLSAPAGSAKNYKERILGSKPDLIVMEFLNDGGLKTDAVNERYAGFLQDFRDIGAEWIVCAPHYMRPDWMGLPSQRGVDTDPREYVKALRAFAAKNHLPLADVSQRYGRLWRQGIPYVTLMKNAINHPDERGLAIYADTLINLFPKQ